MSDIFDENYDQDSEKDISDYADSDVENLDELIEDQKNNKIVEQQLLDEKLTNILRFNAGILDPEVYYSNLKRINYELEKIEYIDDTIDEQLIVLEADYNLMLNNFIQNIKNQRKNNPRQEKDFLSEQEIKTVNLLKQSIYDLQNKYNLINEEDNEPIESFAFESIWKSLSLIEKNQIEKIAKLLKLEIPQKENFKDMSKYKDAQDNFYNDIRQYLPGYFEYYEKKEEQEINSLSKKIGISKPKRNQFKTDSDYNIAIGNFYRDISKFLPGYVYKMNIRSVGFNYELVDDEKIISKIEKEEELLKKLPIILSEDDIKIVKNKITLNKLLNNMENDFLIDNCILNSNVKRFNSKINEDYVQRKGVSKKLKVKPIDTSKKNIKYHQEILAGPTPTKETVVIMRKHSELMNELLSQIKSNQLKSKINKPPLTSYYDIKKEQITSFLRRISKDKLSISLAKRSSKVLEGFSDIQVSTIKDKVRDLENYIYKISSGSVYEYLKKIDDILFILNNYQFIKNGLLTEQINIYQLVLFEKEIIHEAKSIVFPTTIRNRKSIIDKINKTLTFTAKHNNLLLKNSSILTNFMINRKSKKIELLIFDISKDENEYKYKSNIVLNLIKNKPIDIILSNISYEDILDLFAVNIPIPQIQPDYEQYNIKEIEALMSSYTETLNILKKDKIKIEAINATGNFITEWIPPSQLPKYILNQWEMLKQKGDINEMISFKGRLKKSYRLELDPRLYNVIKELEIVENKLKLLNSVRLKKIIEVKNQYLQRYKIFLINKYGNIPKPVIPPKKYLFVSEEIIYEIIQAYKRKIILDLDLDQKNTLMEKLESMDLNELNYKKKFIDITVFNRINSIIDIDKLLPKKYSDLNTIYFKKSFEDITKKLNLNISGSNKSELVKKLFINWPKEYTSQTDIIDFYGNDLFIINKPDPLTFYDIKFIRRYDALVSQNTRKKEEIYKKPQALFNESTGKFGNEAVDGKIYEVSYLQEDPTTHQPISTTKSVIEKDPRTGMPIAVNKTTQLKGITPFILRQLETNKENVYLDIWLKVPKYAVKMYPLNYDSCSRFTNSKTCKGPGLNNSTCYYENNVCKADYTKIYSNGFGKKVKIALKHDKSGKKYKLSDNFSKRHKTLIYRINFEKNKKQISLRKAAIAIKKRLSVLKIYRKNNPKMKKQIKILSDDIKFINNKFKIYKQQI